MSKEFAKKSINSLAVSILPNLIGLMAIPLIVKNVGNAKFGIFVLALAVIGYSGFLDFGMSRILSKSSAEENKNLSHIYSYSVTLVLIGSLIITAISSTWFWFYGYNFLKINADYLNEIRVSIFWVILSTPFTALTGTLRGGLEGMNRFRQANILQVLSGTGNLIIPAIFSYFFSNLSTAFIVLFFFRGFLLGLSFFYLSNSISFRITFKDNFGILKNSLWITSSSFLSPVLLYTDRLILSSFFLLKEISFYATPMDLALRVLVIPQAISRVMLPAFTISKISEEDSNKLYRFSFIIIFITCFPLLWLLAGFSSLILRFWLNPEMSINASVYLTIFSLGLLWNSLTWVTFNILQSHGYFKELTLLQFFSTVLYLIALSMSFSFGLIVFAWLWTIRFMVDTLLFSWLCIKKIPPTKNFIKKKIQILATATILWIPLTITQLTNQTKFVYTITIGVTLVGAIWMMVLKSGDRERIKKFLKVF